MKLFAKSLIFAGVFVLSLNVSAGQVHKLWYDTPAQVWTEALPLGNGRLGAMVYGNPANEQIQLNEETIWAGRPNNNANPEAREWIPKIRKLVFEGRYREAQDMCTAHVNRLPTRACLISLLETCVFHSRGMADMIIITVNSASIPPAR